METFTTTFVRLEDIVSDEDLLYFAEEWEHEVPNRPNVLVSESEIREFAALHALQLLEFDASYVDISWLAPEHEYKRDRADLPAVPTRFLVETDQGTKLVFTKTAPCLYTCKSVPAVTIIYRMDRGLLRDAVVWFAGIQDFPREEGDTPQEAYRALQASCARAVDEARHRLELLR